MAAKRSPIDEHVDPTEALASWQAHRSGAMQDYRKILNERENELLGASGRCGPHSNSWKDARKDLEEAKMQRDGIQGVIRRPLDRYHFNGRWFVVFAVVLAFLEAFVNKFLFDVALGSLGIVSYFTSFALAFFMLILAHLAGRSLRQVWSDYRRRIIWSSIGTFLLMILVLWAMVSILTVGRALTSANARIGSFQDMFAAVSTSVSQLGLWGTLGWAFSEFNALVLATVNIGGIFAAMMLAYFTHDPDKHFDAAATEVEGHRKQLYDLDKKYTDAKTGVIKKYSSHLSEVSTRYKVADKEVVRFKHVLGRALDANDGIVVDELDQLAETSELGEGASGGSPPGKPGVDNAESSENISPIRPVGSAGARVGRS